MKELRKLWITGYTCNPNLCHICGSELDQWMDRPFYYRYDLELDYENPKGNYMIRQCPNWEATEIDESNNHYRREWIIPLDGNPDDPPPSILFCRNWSG